VNDLPPTVRDNQWFEALFVRHGNDVLAYARRRAPDEAEDLVSEVFLTAWRNRDQIPDPALPWLYRTASHQLLHLRRSGARRAALSTRVKGLATLASPDHSDRIASRLDDSRLITKVLARLAPKDAELLRLWAWEQLPTSDIAYVLGTSEAAVRVRLHRARRRARTLLGDIDPDVAAAHPTFEESR
jgi:RNA polymerase sigma-70 factor (ECF subfamily)